MFLCLCATRDLNQRAARGFGSDVITTPRYGRACPDHDEHWQSGGRFIEIAGLARL
jgi:hypothetical protein